MPRHKKECMMYNRQTLPRNSNKNIRECSVNQCSRYVQTREANPWYRLALRLRARE